ncbi:hypothetical protein F4780DRAFT_774346 [Xylariomycetidae sp. FL0641]|nr:hypothetical protein F4780DRAFT_774081 [Xylariomycetidae sp. FL0641]KAI0026150.1 hypothetical protein F4780DRAFT_774346 [Xylariomycetidae sp. FL0641]
MSIGGDGPYCIAVLWVLTGLVSVILCLRLYTRIFRLASYGVDDHFYALTFVLMTAYSSVITVAVEHGYGKHHLAGEEQVSATYYRLVGQTFSILATGTSKASVGSFMLRLVFARWQKILIWAVMLIMGILSVLAALFTWVACKPLAAAYDDRIPNATCLDTLYLSLFLALGTIAADLVFAILPWVFIWKLSAPRRERLMLACTLSLGILAALAGVKRITKVHGVRDVPVGVIVWSQVETALTLICVGITVCGRLWLATACHWLSSARARSRPSENNHNHNKDPGAVVLNTVGGGAMPGGVGPPPPRRHRRRSLFDSLFSTRGQEGGGDDGTRPADDARSEELELTGEAARELKTCAEYSYAAEDADADADADAGRRATDSWIRGETTATLSRAEGHVGGVDDVEQAAAGGGIVTARTYEIRRG